VDRGTVARELAEELRTNTKLRHRLNMDEGTASGVIHEDPDGNGVTPLFFDTRDGQSFAIGVTEVEAE